MRFMTHIMIKSTKIKRNHYKFNVTFFYYVLFFFELNLLVPNFIENNCSERCKKVNNLNLQFSIRNVCKIKFEKKNY